MDKKLVRHSHSEIIKNKRKNLWYMFPHNKSYRNYVKHEQLDLKCAHYTSFVYLLVQLIYAKRGEKDNFCM